MSTHKKKKKSKSVSREKSKIGLNLIAWIDQYTDLDSINDLINESNKFSINAHVIAPHSLNENKDLIKLNQSIKLIFNDNKSQAIHDLLKTIKSKYVIVRSNNGAIKSNKAEQSISNIYESLKKGNDLVTPKNKKYKNKALGIWGVRTSLLREIDFPYETQSFFSSQLNTRLTSAAMAEGSIDIDQSDLIDSIENTNTLKEGKISGILNYYFKEPWRSRTDREFSAYNENPMLRLIFAGLLILSFIGISIMSQSAGISGDEFRYIDQAEKVYNYFASGGSDKSSITKSTIDPQHYNGQSFDNLLFILQKWFQFDDVFQFRHLINSWTGWITMFVAGLIAIGLSGYRAGILVLLFCFFSPRFLGHSFNNHRDIPVAMAAVLTIYFANKFLKYWPFIRWKSLIGLILSIAFAYSLRFGAGVLMTGIVCVSAFIYWLVLHSNFKMFQMTNITRGAKLAILILASSAFAYFIGILNWPFGLEGPFQNGKEVLNATSNLGVSIRQLFEGETIFSNKIPWYYTVKYIGITVPAIILVGSIFSLLGFKDFIKAKKIELFVILFSLLFPLVYTSVMTKNDYGGWRHFLFIFPFLAIASGVGLTLVLNKINNVNIKKWGIIAVVILLIHPIVFTIRSHPYEYVYYNELVGGINGAFGNYETDYSQNSTKGTAEWLIKNADKIVPKGQVLKIGTNNFKALNHYLRDHKDKFQPVYTRYYEKSRHDWDYASYSSTYIDGDQIKSGQWPPKQTVARVEANGVPIGAVVKRVSKEDYLAMEAMKVNDIQKSLQHLNNYIKVNPDNEEVWVAKSRVELAQNNFAEADASVNRALELYPKFISAFDSKGRIMYSSGNFPKAIEYFDKALDIRESYHIAHYFKALSFNQLKKYDDAILSSRKCIGYQQKFKACYDTAAEAYRGKGDPNSAEQYINAKNNIK